MNINDLKIFEAVLRHRSFTNAAAEMHMVQPNVTARIKLLEEEFGKV
ncbi:MAG: LysR family transcriptional regulator [Flavisolibacter sp.]|nr:LysR family transcriptional regulator [Flavisolibacter sp.]MBD0295505.1 LysR family transcriptional regulator [Flavisolibacter sp.]MBD0365065.1 LysR family transcriptional regulator [Flavisolibacter sp.]MBD0374029.1 LysR family transcriptional regulator [Flavisolibacter sp.]